MVQPQKGNRVKMHYTCTLENGSVCDSTQFNDPAELILGQGEILPGLENTLLGMTVGQSTTTTLTPEEAYGDYKPELVTEVDRKEFLDRGIPPEIGLTLEIKQPAGDAVEARVTGVDDGKVRLDANHPLAGKTLRFEIQLVSMMP